MATCTTLSACASKVVVRPRVTPLAALDASSAAPDASTATAEPETVEPALLLEADAAVVEEAPPPWGRLANIPRTVYPPNTRFIYLKVLDDLFIPYENHAERHLVARSPKFWSVVAQRCPGGHLDRAIDDPVALMNHYLLGCPPWVNVNALVAWLRLQKDIVEEASAMPVGPPVPARAYRD